MCLKPKEIKPLGKTNVCQSNDFRQNDVDPTVRRPSGFRPKDANQKNGLAYHKKSFYVICLRYCEVVAAISLSKVSEFQRKM